MATEIVVPALGESVTTATVARWIKQQGETVAADEPLVELETDKVTVEVNAPSAGVLSSIGVPEGTEVEVGAVLGVVDVADGAIAGQPAAPKPAAAAAPASQPEPRPAANPPAGINPPPRPLGPVSRPAASEPTHAPLPAAAKMLAENKVSAERPRHRHRQGRPHHQGRRDRISFAPCPGARRSASRQAPPPG